MEIKLIYKSKFKENKKLASSGSLEGIQKLIGQYFYSPNIKLDQISNDTWSISNLKGIMSDFNVVYKKNKYIFQEL